MPVLNHGLPCPFSLAPMASVLDIGAGIRPQTMFSTPRHVCVEPHFEYADALRESGYEVIETTWRDALKEIPDDSFDMVMALDVIEHLTKEEGWELKRATCCSSLPTVSCTNTVKAPTTGGYTVACGRSIEAAGYPMTSTATRSSTSWER